MILQHRSTAQKHSQFEPKLNGNSNTYNQAEDAWKVNIRSEDKDFSCGADGTVPWWYWTGPNPLDSDVPGMVKGKISSLPHPHLSASSKQDILDYFDNTWLITEIIFSGLNGQEAFYRPPYHNLRHPMIFYYGHPAALYVNKLRVSGLLSGPVNDYFEHIFETGVDEMAWDDLSKNDMMWPMVKEVTEYRRTVYNIVRKIIIDSPVIGSKQIRWEDPEWALFMGFEHERIHIETSTVLIRELPIRLVKQPIWWPEVHPDLHSRPAPENPIVSHEPQTVVLGKPLNWPTYGWDNEYGCREFYVPEFKASKFQITNQEFLEFVKSGGYRNESLWTTEGWQWKTFRNAKWPVFWVPDGPAGLNKFCLRLIWAVVPLPPAAPVIVNAHEARAFAAWKTQQHTQASSQSLPFRLLTEAEHNALRPQMSGRQVHNISGYTADEVSAADPIPSASGAALHESKTANIQLAYGAEAPVDAFLSDSKPSVFGNAWSWCEDWFSALPGSHGVHPVYDDFSSPCYDGEHSVIMGGSFMSTGDEASRFARFHFRPHFHQHASFYVAQSVKVSPLSHVDSPPPHVGSWNPASGLSVSGQQVSQAKLAMYATAHYGVARDAIEALLPDVADFVPDFPASIAFMVEKALGTGTGKAGAVMDVGCTVGGVAFKLAEVFDRVVAIDRDSDMLAVAEAVKTSGFAHLSNVPILGGLETTVEIKRPVAAETAERVTFKHMDPCCIAPDIGQYDAVLLNDVLDRVVSPKGPLSRMGGVNPIVKPGGFDWKPEVTDKQLWLGSSSKGAVNGRNGTNGHSSRLTQTSHTVAVTELNTRSAIADTLGDNFEFVMQQNIPTLSMENSRKYCLKVLRALVWRHCCPETRQ